MIILAKRQEVHQHRIDAVGSQNAMRLIIPELRKLRLRRQQARALLRFRLFVRVADGVEKLGSHSLYMGDVTLARMLCCFVA